MFAVLLRMSPWAFDWRVLPVIVAFEEFKMLTAVIALERLLPETVKSLEKETLRSGGVYGYL